MKPLVFMLIAGEPSGDLLAAELVKALKLSPHIQANPFPPEFFGAGGPKMAAEDVELALDLTRHSVIGVSDVLKKYWEFKRIFDRLFALALERQPDVIICVDFSGFNRRFAHGIKEYVRAQHGSFNNWAPKIVQYVSPQVWASRPGRVYQIARDYDLLLSIFPFEKEWYAARVPQLRVEFVGHPMVDRFQKSEVSQRSEISKAPPLILLLPGSRAGEVHRHLPVMFEVLARMKSEQPDLRARMVLPNEQLKKTADTFCLLGKAARIMENGKKETAQTLPSLETQVGGLEEALAQADLAITKSGTITLECAFFGVPAVVFYKTSWISYFAGKMAINVSHLAMPNLLAGEEIYPEFIQHRATPENIARAALELLIDVARCTTIRQKLARVVESLGPPGAAARSAIAIMNLFSR